VAAYVDGVLVDLGRTEFPIKAPALQTRFKCGIDDGNLVGTKIWVDVIHLRICP
jgi:hypothetical protein